MVDGRAQNKNRIGGRHIFVAPKLLADFADTVLRRIFQKHDKVALATDIVNLLNLRYPAKEGQNAPLTQAIFQLDLHKGRGLFRRWGHRRIRTQPDGISTYGAIPFHPVQAMLDRRARQTNPRRQRGDWQPRIAGQFGQNLPVGFVQFTHQPHPQHAFPHSL